MSNISETIKRDLDRLEIDTTIAGQQRREMERLREEMASNKALLDMVNRTREESSEDMIEAQREAMRALNRMATSVNGRDTVVLPINATFTQGSAMPIVGRQENRNIDPQSFRIMDLLCVGDYLIARIKYNGCTTCEGVKILLVSDIDQKSFRNLKAIDPYFDGNNSDFKLIARFAPTEEGMNIARMLAKNLTENKPVVKKVIRKMTME